jgi:creatinine amidohydrolase/Fe(II)-dependent formamide hydrolase-like protein
VTACTSIIKAALATGTVLCLTAPLAAQQGQTVSAEERARRQAEAERAYQAEMAAPRQIDALNSVWIEELTWMEVRDAIRSGKTTAIIPTGGVEPNGPWVATGKHNYVLESACDRLARALGDALCAPIVKLVPEGDIDPPTSHMRYPGTISLRQETFEAVLTDVAMSLKAHGFTDIVFIGDSGGNQRGQAAVAERLNGVWTDARAHQIEEFYDYDEVLAYMEGPLGFKQPIDDGLHDNFYITAIMMVTDPTVVRYDQRVKAGKTLINGLDIAPKERAIELGHKLLDFRVEATVRAIRASMAGS